MSTKQKVYPWLIVIAWAFISAASIELVLIGGTNYFKSVSDAVGSPVSFIALMMTCCTITLSICAPIAGNLFAKFDSRILLTVMSILVVGGYMCLSFGQSGWQWVLTGVIYGIGGSGIFIIGGPIFIGNWFAKRTGLATGCYAMVLAALSMILQPCIGGAINAFGWRTAYLVMGCVSLVMTLPWTLFVVRFKPEQIGLKPFGWQEDGGIEETEKKQEAGVPYGKAIKTAAFVLLVIAFGFECNLGGFKSNWSNIAQSAAWGYVDLNGKEWAVMFGATMLSFTTACKFLSPVAGWLADRIGAIKTTTICLVLLIIGFLLMWFAYSIPAAVLLGCFFVGFDSVIMKTMIPLCTREVFGPRDYSKIYSLLYGIINFLGAFATSLIALMGEISGGWDGVFLLGIILCCGNLIFMLASKAASKKLVWEEA